MEKNIFTSDDRITLRPLTEENKDDYFLLLQQTSSAPEDYTDKATQDFMWELLKKIENLNYSVFDENDEYCGNLVIQDHLSATPEIGIDLLINKRCKGIAARAIRLYAKKAYNKNTIDHYLIKALEANTHSRRMIEKTGAVFSHIEERISKKMLRSCLGIYDDFKSDYIKEKLKQRISEMESIPDDVYVYKLMPEAFI
ncbi:MAG: GNAT family N-acetyltransferase [Oscillospiraceae bacterium]|nr:GNAT family N-acetyltransferase [Oscillospiraceae bacterium]